MITKQVTPEQIEEWKRIYEENRTSLQPNRKTGAEVEQYVKEHYSVTKIISKEADQVVFNNVVMNDIFKEKLPDIFV